MRGREVHQGLTIQAIAGTHAVLLGLDCRHRVRGIFTGRRNQLEPADHVSLRFAG
jgi:hypothetical protein